MDPSCLRLVGPVHIAETRERARENVKFGLEKWVDYFSRINPMAAGRDMSRDPVDGMIESGRAVIGTPDDAIAQLERLEKQTPHFHRANRHREQSLGWASDNSKEFIGAAMTAARQMIQKHADEEREKEEAKQASQ
ncbi:MAG: hypothetical protein V3V67_13780 [Myxococcota bacterium]